MNTEETHHPHPEDCEIPALRELADRFDVDLRTMRRDLSLLREAGWNNFNGYAEEKTEGANEPNRIAKTNWFINSTSQRHSPWNNRINTGRLDRS